MLLGVPQLQRTGPGVRRGLLAIRQSDGGGQIDQALGQVGVGGLETTRPVHGLETLRLHLGLEVRRGRDASVCGTGAVHLRLGQEVEEFTILAKTHLSLSEELYGLMEVEASHLELQELKHLGAEPHFHVRLLSPRFIQSMAGTVS